MSEGLPDLKMTFAERAATSMPLMVYARVAMLAFGIIGSIGVPVGAFLVTRLINAIDTMNERQRQNGQDFAILQTQVLNIVNDQVRAQKNVADRIEQGEAVLRGQISQQISFVALLTQKLDDLSKYVYTKVR